MADATISAATRLVKPGAPGEDSEYPLYLSQVRAAFPNTSFPSEPLEEYINSLGYFVVEDAEKPESSTQMVEEGQPVFEDGVWKQTWVVRDFTTDEATAELATRKTRLLAEITDKTETALNTGYSFDFQDGKAAGHVQLRDGDRANLAGSRTFADALIKKGLSNNMPFRDLENVTHMVPPEVIVELTDGAYMAYLSILNNSWTLKDQVTAAVDIASLPVVPEVITAS